MKPGLLAAGMANTAGTVLPGMEEMGGEVREGCDLAPQEPDEAIFTACLVVCGLEVSLGQI